LPRLHRPYGINGNYPDIVLQKLKNLGLRETGILKLLVVPIRHPVTLKRGGSGIKDSLEGKYKRVPSSYHRVFIPGGVIWRTNI